LVATAQLLPLFPLHTVLFPDGVLPLRIFEQRYIEMTKECLRDAKPFGVCLLAGGSEVMGEVREAPPFAHVGTLARIVDWDMPETGILHLRVEGGSRFRVVTHELRQSGLLVGATVALPVEAASTLPADCAPLARLVELMARHAGPGRFPVPHRLDDASWVSCRLAEALPLPLPIKQDMLEVNDALVRLRLLQGFLRRQGILA
jgi:Lon protease-like protein